MSLTYNRISNSEERYTQKPSAIPTFYDCIKEERTEEDQPDGPEQSQGKVGLSPGGRRVIPERPRPSHLGLRAGLRRGGPATDQKFRCPEGLCTEISTGNTWQCRPDSTASQGRRSLI